MCGTFVANKFVILGSPKKEKFKDRGTVEKGNNELRWRETTHSNSYSPVLSTNCYIFFVLNIDLVVMWWEGVGIL